MIDQHLIGRALTPFWVTAEKSQLRFFAKATGQQDPVYTDEAAARAAGYRSLPLPPTFFFSMECDAPDPGESSRLLGVDTRKVLHGEQHFTYHRDVCAGESLKFEPKFTEIYAKKGGALEFVVRETRVSNEAGELVAELKRTIVVRHG